MDASLEQHRKIARRLLEEFWSGEDDGIADELFTAGFHHHMAPEGTPPGPDGQKALVASVRGQVPGLRIAVDDVIAEGDRVAVRWTATFEPAPGEQESYPGADILRLEDGRSAELWSFVP